MEVRLVGLDPDGAPESFYSVTRDVTEIGRRGRDIAVPDDEEMADHHASLVYESGEFFIADSGQGSGVWLRVASGDDLELENEGQIWLGGQILLASAQGNTWALLHYGPDAQLRGTIRIGEREVIIGRGSEVEVELDPDDNMLSRRHARLCVDRGRLVIRDRESRNGTFVKVSGASAVVDGSEFRMTTRRYRLEVSAGIAEGEGGFLSVK
jgi:pSer/pThr/pTyr-binding forkhead associated (FHA) protein